MALTASTMLALGTLAPAFHLSDVTTGRTISLESFPDRKALLVMFICRHCPYVKFVEHELARIGHDYARHVGIVAISSNDVETHPEDSPDSLREQARACGFCFPYCHDETQQVALSFSAACTPDFFVFDAERRLVYRGQLDDSRPGRTRPVDGRDLRDALDAVLEGRSPAVDQKPSVGCNIKWKHGLPPSPREHPDRS